MNLYIFFMSLALGIFFSAQAFHVNTLFVAKGHAPLHQRLARPSRICRRQILKAVSLGWQQSCDSEDGIKYAHDEITYRARSGETLHIPQVERYSTKDWLHNLSTMPTSRLLKRIRGILIFNFVWSAIVFIAHRLFHFYSPGSRTHALLGSALGLLLVFRTNSAYNRFWEGRQIWEKVLNSLRGLSRMTVVFSDIVTPPKVERILLLLCAFPFVLQEHVQGYDMPQQYSKFLSQAEMKNIERVTNRPQFILATLLKEISTIKERGFFTSRERQTMASFVDKLSDNIGSSERLVQTPVPLTYARHTSRFLSLFLLSAPVALVGELDFFVIPFTTFMAWSLFGILEIGMMIEEPFQRALKLEVFGNTIRRDISDLLHTDISLIDLNITCDALRYEPPFFARGGVSLFNSTMAVPAVAAKNPTATAIIAGDSDNNNHIIIDESDATA